MEVYFFSQGNTAVFDEDGNQMSELQKPYIILFAEFLKSQGFDPTKAYYRMPDGKHVQLFSVSEDEAYNWRFI